MPKFTHGQLVTNGDYLSRGNETEQPNVLRQFRIIGYFNAWIWALPVNGNYTGDGPLSFHESALRSVE